MAKDYSEYRLSDYEKYLLARSGGGEIRLKYFRNSARFDPDGKGFYISVDPCGEFHYMNELIEEVEREEELRIGKKLDEPLTQEDIKEFEELRRENEEENVEILNMLKKKYRIDRTEADRDREECAKESGKPPEPLINVLSGAYVALNYGEGLLDFIYADFLTPLQAELRNLKGMKAFIERQKADSDYQDGEPEGDYDYKVRSSDEETVNDFFDYEASFSAIKYVAYSSLYTAVCPPVFESKFDIEKELNYYCRYLLTLQSEYRELVEFCYDEDFYPEVLGGLHPAERYALYRRFKNLPIGGTRSEKVSFSVRKLRGDAPPFGLPGEKIIERLSSELNITPQHIALAKSLGADPEELALAAKIPHYLHVSYQFGSTAEILDLEFTKMLENNIRFKKCKRCGKYFIMKGNYDANYCDRVADGETRTCQELAASEKYKLRTAGDKALPLYSRYYKRYAARVKSRQIKDADFRAWRYAAIAKRDSCSAGEITPEEYEQWLEGSFPNRRK